MRQTPEPADVGLEGTEHRMWQSPGDTGVWDWGRQDGGSLEGTELPHSENSEKPGTKPHVARPIPSPSSAFLGTNSSTASVDVSC